MTNLTVPVERITAEARKVDGRKALTSVAAVVASLLLGIPWVLGWVVHKLWMALTVVWMAAVVGWRDAGHRDTEDGTET